MKVTVKGKSEERKYPWIGEIDCGCVILFSRYSAGIMLKACPLGITGDYSEGWDMDDFTPFQGEITLSNGDV